MNARNLPTVILSVAAVVAGCTRPAPEAPDLTVAARAIAAADSAWSAAAASGNLEASAEVVAEDGIMFPPDAPPIIGRAAVREFMRQSLAVPGFSARWLTDTVIVAGSGDLAYAFGRSRYTFPDSAGAVDTVYAKAVVVWRRDPAGTRLLLSAAVPSRQVSHRPHGSAPGSSS